MDIFTLENLVALLTLTVLEIVLGIDNIVFISIMADRLPEAQQGKARRLGLGAALLTRILLLLSLSWVIQLTEPLFTLWGFKISGRDLILFVGGLFLLYKSTHEIHDKLEGKEGGHAGKAVASLTGVVIQIGLLDLIFSLDSVITAVGLAQDVAVMIIAIIAAVGVMMFAAKAIGEFVDRHPTIKVLALSFLVVVGVALIAEGFDWHVPRGYIYFAMAFSTVVEMLNIRMRKKAKPVKLHKPIEENQ